jgi:hypothetical protein
VKKQVKLYDKQATSFMLVYICNLFNDDVTNSGYIASNDRMMVNELVRIRNKVVDQFKALLSQNLSRD